MKSCLPAMVSCLVLAAPALAQQASPAAESRDRLVIDEGGRRRVMEVALDEALLENANGSVRFAAFPVKNGVAELASHCRTIAGVTGEKPALVVYERGAARSEDTRRIVTSRILIRLKRGADAAFLARMYHAVLERPAVNLPGCHLLVISDPLACLDTAAALRARPEVISAEPVLARKRRKRAIPNDPLFGDQWHLNNTGQNGGAAGIDINVTGVWGTFGGAGLRGSGIRIGIVDDGFQLTHPDLVSNVDTAIDYDWNDGTPLDATPNPSIDDHGTPVAGIAAAVSNNGLGVSGVAPEATLVSLRLISQEETDVEESEAMLHRNDLIHVKNNSWGPNDDGKTLEGPGVLTAAAFQDAVENGRGGLGTILVWAGGNGRTEDDNVNKDGFANSIYTIAVGAIGDQGQQTFYSEPGACLIVSAPSDDLAEQQWMTTTDLTGNNGLENGDYTHFFGGTSAATPVVAGVVALMLEANPSLGWRDVQEILMASATMIDPGNGDWIVNGGGFRFNHGYGAGLVNAQAAVSLAGAWTNLDPQATVTVTEPALNTPIPNGNSSGIDVAFDLSATNLRVEHVTAKVNITHGRRGHLAIRLTSPSGTVSRLVEHHGDRGDHYADWTFMTAANWGEVSAGTWTLNVADLEGGDSGTLHSAELTVYGAEETFTLSGVVLEKGSGNPLSGVTVTAGAFNTTSGGGGAYTLTGLTSGSYNVTAALPDYTSDSASVNLGPDSVANFELRGPLDLSDPDGDGAVNLLETALHMDHDIPDPLRLPQGLTVDVSGTEYPAIEYRRLKGGAGTTGVDYAVDGIKYRVEISNDLESWQSGPAAVETVSVSDDGNGITETVVVRMESDPGSTKVFVRLVVTYTPAP